MLKVFNRVVMNTSCVMLRSRKTEVGVISIECSNDVRMNEAGWWWERMMKVDLME